MNIKNYIILTYTFKWIFILYFKLRFLKKKLISSLFKNKMGKMNKFLLVFILILCFHLKFSKNEDCEEIILLDAYKSISIPINDEHSIKLNFVDIQSKDNNTTQEYVNKTISLNIYDRNRIESLKEKVIEELTDTEKTKYIEKPKDITLFFFMVLFLIFG